MAIQATEDATTFREWLLLGTALVRVIEYLGPGSERAAKKLLLEYLDREKIPWRCRRLDFGDGWTYEAAKRFFFERHASVVHDIDWPNHYATRAGPVFVPVSAIGAKVLAYGPRTLLEAREIILHWPSILRILQSFGAAPWSAESPSLAEGSPPNSENTPEVMPEETSEVTSAAASGELPEKLSEELSEESSEKSSEKSSEMPLTKADAFVHWAAEHCPPEKVAVNDYFQFLREKSGERWSKKTLQNCWYAMKASEK
jgi:hypothetical protein